MSGLENVAAGDTVLWVHGASYARKDDKYLVRVTKTTPTQITIRVREGVEEKFRRSNGEAFGNQRFMTSRIQIPTDQDRAEIELEKRLRKLENHKWRNEKPELIATIYALLVGASTAAEREKEGER